VILGGCIVLVISKEWIGWWWNGLGGVINKEWIGLGWNGLSEDGMS